MSAKISIKSTPPEAITTTTPQPDAAELSLNEVRICFPGRVAMAVDDEECIVLEDAPLIGVVIELATSLLRLKQGAHSAEVVDFYGEYKLVFRETGETLECENEFTSQKCRAPSTTFRAAAQTWCNDTLADVEKRHTNILKNPNYQRLKTHIADTWRDQRSAD